MKRYIQSAGVFLLMFWAAFMQAQAQCPNVATASVSVTNVTCHGANDGTITFTINQGTPPFTFLLWSFKAGSISPQPFATQTISNGGRTVVFSGLSGLPIDENYLVSVGKTGCPNQFYPGLLTLTEPEDITLTLAAQTNITGCFGDATGAFTMTTTGGNGGFEYSIDGGTTFGADSTFTNLTAGTYTVIVRDSKNCQKTRSVTITQPPLLQLTLDTATDPLCNGNSNGTISMNTAGGTAPYQYSINGGAFVSNGGNFTGLASGTYEIVVQDSQGCKDTVSNITLTDPAVLTVAFDSKVDILGCFGDATGEIKVIPGGGVGPYTYSANGGAFVSNAGNFTGLTAGTYTITVRDANNCIVVLPTTVTLTEPPLLTLALASKTDVLGCFGDMTGDITVTAGGGQPTYEYSIDNGVTFQSSPNFAGLAAGTYTLRVRDTKNCIATLSNIVITQPTPLAASFAFTNPLCKDDANGTITITASGAQPPYQYSINGGAFQGSNVFSGLTDGVYSIRIQDSRNCELILPDITLTEPDLLVLTISSQQDITTCAGDATGQIAVSATGGTTAYQYSRDNGATFQASPTFSGLTAGTYTILVRDANGCVATAPSVTLTEPPVLTLALTAQTNVLGCFGDATGDATVTAGGGQPPYQYSIGGAFQASNVFTGLTAGSYTITVRDTKNCTATVPLTITQPTQLTASLAAQTNIACFGQSTGSITVSANGGQPAYEYSIDNGTTFQTTPIFGGLAAGTYSVLIRDTKNCTATVANVVLTQPTQLTASVASQQDPGCNSGTDGSIVLTTGGGVAPYTYSLNGGGFVSNGGNFTGLSAGTYNIQVQDANACMVTLAPVTLTDPSLLQLTLVRSSDATCNGTATGSAQVNASGGTPGYQYSIGGAFQVSSTFNGLTAGSYTITVRDAKGCTATVPVTINEPTPLVLSVSVTDASCNGTSDGTASVNASGGTPGYTYTWNSTPVQTTPVATGLPAGTYIVTVRDANNCIRTATVTVGQPAVVTAPAATSPAAICTGSAIPALTAGGSNIKWYSDAGLTTLVGTGSPFTPTLDNSVAGSTTFFATQTIGVCEGPATSVTIVINQTPVAPAISGTLTFCTGNNTILTSSATTGNQWLLNGNPIGGATNQTLTVTTAGDYSVQITANGCTATSAVATVTEVIIPTPTISGTATFCTSGNTVLTSSATTGNQWLLNGNPIAGATNQTLTVSIAGNYSVRVSQSGCSATSSVVAVSETTTPTPTASSPAAICTGDAAPALTAAGTNIQWYSDAGLTTLVGSGSPFTPTLDTSIPGTTNFFATQTVGSCQSAGVQVTITVRARPAVPTISGTATFCTSGNTVLTSSAATGNQWLLNGNPIGGATNQTITVTAAGDYSVQVTVNGCSSTSAVTTVNEITVPVPTISGPVTFCAGSSTTLTSSAATGNQWLLNGNPIAGETNQTLTVTTAGNYSVRVTQSGCTATSTIVAVTQSTTPAPTASSPAPICTGSAIPALTASGSTIQWYSDAGLTTLLGTGSPFTPTLDNSVAGTTTFFVTQTVSGCQSAATSVSITINQTPATPTISGTATFCTSGNTVLTSSAATGNQWLLNGNPIAGATNQTLTVSAAGDYSVMVIANGCSATSAVVTVTETNVTPTISGIPSFCSGNSTTLTSSAATGNQWLLNGNPISGETNQTLTVTTAGNYSVRVTQSGCTATSTVVAVSESTTPAPAATSPAAICTGSSIPALTAGGSNIKWYSDAGLTTLVGTGSPFTPTLDNSVAGTNTFFVTQTAGTCESAATTVAITINATPSKPTVTGTLSFCAGNNTILTSSATTGNQWLLNGNPIGGATNQTLTVTTAGDYAVMVTVNGCSATSDAATVTTLTTPAPTAASPAAICTGSAIPALTASGSTIQWYSDAGLTTLVGTGSPFTPTLDNSVAGTTTFFVTQTVSGCQSAATSVSITINQTPATPIINGTLTFCTGGNTVLTSSAGTGNQWLLNGNPIAGATNQTLTVTTAGNYSVQVTQSGCSATSAVVTVTEPVLTASVAVSQPSCSNPNSGALTVTVTAGAAPFSYSLDGTDFSNTSGVFSSLSGGSYTVFVRDATGCTISSTHTINTVVGISAATLNPTDETACGASDGRITVSGISGAAGPYQYFINGNPNPAGINNNVFTSLAPGSYTIRILAANGCDLTRTVVVDTDCITCTLTAGVASQVNPTCNGNDGSIVLTSANGIGAVSYSIDGGTNFNTNPVFNGLSAGNYSVIVRDANNCIVNVGTVTLNAPVAITATITGTDPTTCGVNDGIISISNTTGGTAPYQYSIDGINFQTATTFTGLASNNYTVSIKDANNCIVTFNQIITAPNGISTITVNTTSESGCSTADGQITVSNVSGGTTPYQYFINSNPNPAGINNNVFTGLTGGVYNIRVQAANGCSFTTTASVGTNCPVPCTITATVSHTDLACQGDANARITVSASGGTGVFEYSIDGTTFQSVAVFNNLSANAYTITIRDKNNPSCRITRNVTITNPPAITGSVVSSTNPSCQNNDGSITVTASGGTGALLYSLNGGAPTNTLVFTGLTAGTYAISVRDANNCTFSIGSVTLTTPTAITATLVRTNPSTCSASDGQIEVTNVQNGTAPYEYSLNGSAFQASTTFTGLAVGSYLITVRDAAGCTSTLASVGLAVNVVITASVSSTNPTSCTVSDGTITVGTPSGGTAPYQYSINGIFQASNVFTNLPELPFPYVVAVRDANGCISPVGMAVLTAPNSITSINSTSTDETTCNAANGTITVSNVTGGTAPYQYFIDGNPNPAGINNNTFSGLVGGIYSIRVVTADGCSFTRPDTVMAACCLQASISSNTDASCKGNDGIITITATGGNGTILYSIDNGANFGASSTFSNLTAGIYTVVVRDNVCQKPAGTVTINSVPLDATVTATNPNGCSATNGQIAVTNVTGGTAPYTYSIDGFTYTSTATFTNLSSGDYTVFVQDAGGCISTFSRTLAPGGGILTVETSTTSETDCATLDGQVQVTNVIGIAGPYQYFINGTINPAGANNPIFTGLASGPYSIRVVAPNGCDFTVTAVVGSNCNSTCTLAAVVGSQRNPTCAGNDGSITVSVTNGTGTIQYSIDGGNTFGTNPVFTGLTAGNYSIIVQDTRGCRVTVTATLTAPAVITATISGGNPTSCTTADGSITITNPTGGSAPYEYALNGGAFQTATTFTGLTGGNYTLTVRDANGCTATFTQALTTPGGITATLATTNETACRANDGQVTVTVSGATGVVEYYVNGNPNPAGLNNNVFTSLAPGSYTIRVKDAASGCEFTTSATVTVFTCPVNCTLSAQVTYSDPNCTNPTSGSITITPTGGTAPYQYSMNGGAFAAGTGQFTGLGVGSYTVRVRDAAGCIFALNPVNMVAPSGPRDLVALVTAQSSCTVNDGVIEVTNVAGGTVPYLYSINGGSFRARNRFTGLAPGTYTIAVRDGKGCEYSESVTVRAAAGLTATLATTNETACNAADGQVTVTVSGATGVVEYYVNGNPNPAGLNNNVFTALAPGSYTIRVKDAANNCEFTASATVTAFTCSSCTLAATANTTPPTCAAPNSGTITVSVTGGTAPFEYALNGGAFAAGTGNFTGLAFGSYDIVVRDAAGCIFTIPTVVFTTPAISVNATVTDMTSCTSNDGSIQATVSGGTAPFSYSLDGVTFTNTTGTFTGLTAGSYTITVRDATGCVASQIQTVTAPSGITAITLTPTAETTCSAADGSIAVSGITGAAGPYQYFINGTPNPAGINTATFTGLTPGIYGIEVIAANGCSFTGSVTVPTNCTTCTVSATVTSVNNTNCASPNGSITIVNPTGGSAPYEYSLDGGASFQAATTFTGLAAGSYLVIVRDANGCTYDETITLSAPGNLTANVTVVDETACNTRDGQITVLVSGGTAPFEYFLNGVANAGSNVFSNLAPGNYTIRVTDANNCTYTTGIGVAAFGCTCTLTASATPVQPTCTTSGSIAVSVSGGTAPFEYALNGGAFAAGTGNFTGLAFGSYDIVVRDAAGCTFTIPTVVFTTPMISVTVAASNLTSCTVNDGSLSASVMGGTAPFSYSLDGVTFTNTTGTFTGLSAGSYTVFVRDAAGCQTSATQILTAPGGITAATLTPTTETACSAADGTIAVSGITGAAGPYQYFINGSPNPAGVNTATFTGLTQGSYTIQVIAANGCSFTGTVAVPTNCTPCTVSATVTSTNITNCTTTDGSISITNPTGGTAPYEYSLDGFTFQTANTFTGLSAGNYLVVVRDVNGCAYNESVTLSAPGSFTASLISQDETSCKANNGTVTVTVTGGVAPFSYFLNGVLNAGGNVFSNLAPGTYTIRITDANNCAFTTTASIAAFTCPCTLTASATSTQPTCATPTSGSITVSTTGGTAPFEYSLNGGAFATGTGQFTGLSAGSYSIVVRDAAGCTFTVSTVTLTTPSIAVVVTASNPTSCTVNDGSLSASVTGGTAPFSYSLDGVTFTNTTGTFTGLSAGSYTVFVRDAAGCQTSATQTLTAPGSITATLSTTNETACRANDGRITVSVSGAGSTVEYYVNGNPNPAGLNNNVFTALAPGSYTIRVKDATSGCEFTTSATVTAFICPPPTCTLTAQAFSNPVLCSGVSDGSAILVNVSGGSGNYEYSIDNGVSYQNTPLFTSLGVGTYNILVRDRNDNTCFATFPVVVATRFDVGGIIIVNQPKTCGDKGTITFTNVFGGQAPYQFSINGTTFVSDTAFTNLNPGTYQATIRDSKGCRFSAPIQVIGGAAITATVAQGQPATCGQPDGTIVISNVSGGSGVFVYSLDGTNFTGNTTFDKLAAGAYTVYIKEQNGSCVATFPVTVTSQACCQLTITPTSTQPTACTAKDGSISLAVASGVAPYTYRLNNGPTQSSSVFSGLGNGLYTITVADSKGCEANISVILTSPNAITAQAEMVTSASCFGKPDGTARIFNVTGGSGSYEYSMDDITYQSTALFTGLKAGVYLLYVRDKASGCLASYPVTVTEATQITATVTATQPSVCAAKDGSIRIANITGGVGPYQVSLDSLTGYQSTLQFSNLGNGTYKVYIRDSKGCMAVYPMRLNSPNAVTVGTPTLVNPTCQGSNNGEIRMGIASGGQPPYQFSINNGTYQSTGIFTALSAGSYTIRIKDQSGCEYPFDYTLTEPQAISFEVRQTKEVTCEDPTGSVEITKLLGGTPPYRFSLNNVDFQTSPIFSNLAPGDYVMYVKDVSRTTCSSTKPFIIRGAKKVSYQTKIVHIGCSGTDKGSLTVYKITGGIETGAPVQYSISINGGTTFRDITTDSTTFENLDAGVYDIVIEYGSGCRTTSQQVFVNAGSIPFDVATIPATCGNNNGSATAVIANPIPGKTYFYSIDSVNYFTTPTFANLYAKEYKMYVRESLTDVCPNIRTFTVAGPDSVRYQLRRQDCNTVIVDSIKGGVMPYRIKLEGRENIETGVLFQNNFKFANLKEGTYTLTITDALGCSTFAYNFLVGNKIGYKIRTTPSVIEEPTGSVFIYDITGGLPPYEVSVDGQNWGLVKDTSIPIDTLVEGIPVGLLTVYVRDASGCIQPINTEIAELKFFVPNLFTPNGDGINDTFFITKLPSGTFVKIVDRWGKVIFETRDYKNDWDGSGSPDGVYFYTIDIAGEKTYRGWVQIWR